MFEIFNNKITSSNGLSISPVMDYIRRTYSREVHRVIEYYNSRPFFVRSNHLLCRIINTGYIPVTYDVDRYVEISYTRLPYIAKLFKLTSSVEYGNIFDGDFYGSGNREIIISVERYFDIQESELNWKKLQPVKVISHHISDFNILLPNGKNNSSGSGYCFIEVDLPLLLFQYRCFQLEQIKRNGSVDDNVESLLGVTHFVNMYVLPGMLESHVDYIFLNRLKALYYGEPFTESLNSHVFHVIDYSDKIDLALKAVIKRFKDNRFRYEVLLKNIPCVFVEDMQEKLILPDLALTRQAWWAIAMSKFDVIEFMIDLGNEKGRIANRDHLAKLKVVIKRLLNDGTYIGILNKDDAYDVNEKLLRILDKC